MSVALSDGVIALDGACLLEEASILLDLLLAHPEAPIDLDKCDRLHMAVAQILLAARGRVRRDPEGSFLDRFFTPLLREVTS